MIQNVRSVENRIMKTDGFHCRPVKMRSCKKYGHTSKFSELYLNYQKKCLKVKKNMFYLTYGAYQNKFVLAIERTVIDYLTKKIWRLCHHRNLVEWQYMCLWNKYVWL